MEQKFENEAENNKQAPVNTEVAPPNVTPPRQFSGSESSYRPDLEDTGDEHSNSPTVVFSCPVDHAGTTVYVKGWKTSDLTRPPIIFVHDLGQNLGFYRDAAAQFVEKGFNFFCFDLRGHGCSGRMLGHVSAFSELVNDLLQVAAWTRHRCNGKNPIIIGNGIGALVALFFQQKYPHLCQATVLSAPCFELSARVSRLTRIFIKSCSDITPKFKLPKFFTPAFIGLSHPAKGRRPHTLTLPVFSGISVNFANELLDAMQRVRGGFLAISKSTLILCPKDDDVCEYDLVDELLHEHPYADLIAVKGLPDTSHQVFAENPKTLPRAVDIVVDWVNKLPARP